MISTNKAYFREATQQDVEILYNWANDPVCRDNSFSSEMIAYETHVQWYKNLLNNKLAKQYILTVDDGSLGQTRVNIDGEVAEISYSIAPGYRCMGYGKLIISLLPDVVKKDFPNVKKLVARVKPDNVASRKAFVDNCYLEKCQVYELYITENARFEEQINYMCVGGYSS